MPQCEAGLLLDEDSAHICGHMSTSTVAEMHASCARLVQGCPPTGRAPCFAYVDQLGELIHLPPGGCLLREIKMCLPHGASVCQVAHSRAVKDAGDQVFEYIDNMDPSTICMNFGACPPVMQAMRLPVCSCSTVQCAFSVVSAQISLLQYALLSQPVCLYF